MPGPVKHLPALQGNFPADIRLMLIPPGPAEKG